MSEAKKILPTAKVSSGPQGKGRCPHTSNVEIFFDGKLIATACLGGKYDEKSALTAFKKERNRFKLTPEAEFALSCGV